MPRTLNAGAAIAPPGISGAAARWAGALYLGTIAFGLFAEIGVRARVRAADAATTASNIVHQQSWYRLGEAADLAMLGCYIAVTALLYRLFATGARSLSLVAAGFSLIGIAVLAVAGMLHLAPLALSEYQGLARPDLLAQLALDLHGDLYGISLVFFGVYCLLIGILCVTSRLLPLPIGLLMIAGGLAHIVTRLLWIAAPAARHALPGALDMLPLAGEAALAAWLLLAGLPRTRST
ncbi:DUF4386 domain-containing protein [Rhizorhabdus histidinilytica]|uniref:DUF4386 domain-containing protein n=1 Tax=Rhizorhabdus histidinilytica TaxID=439228 RepID=UPI00321F7B33